MVSNSPDHIQIGKDFLALGSCDHGLYPLQTRFYMDQIPLNLLKYGKRSLSPVGAGYFWITGTNKKISKRWVTIQL